MKEIYVLFKREPEARIIGVFSSRAIANMANRSLLDMEGDLYVYILDELAEKATKGREYYHAYSDPVSGKTVVWESFPGDTFIDDDDQSTQCTGLYMGFWAKDKDDAMRIAKEKTDKYLAEFKNGKMGFRIVEE